MISVLFVLVITVLHHSSLLYTICSHRFWVACFFFVLFKMYINRWLFIAIPAVASVVLFVPLFSFTNNTFFLFFPVAHHSTHCVSENNNICSIELVVYCLHHIDNQYLFRFFPRLLLAVFIWGDFRVAKNV